MSRKDKKQLWLPSKDGPVFTGLFKLRDTHGVPLSLMMRSLTERKDLFSVPHFIAEAKAAGWSATKIRAELHEAWSDLLLPKHDIAELERVADVFINVAG